MIMIKDCKVIKGVESKCKPAINATFAKSPMLWDLICSEEYINKRFEEGKIRNRHISYCLIYALFKLAFRKRMGRVEATYSMLSDLSGLSTRTVIRTVNELEQIGIIKIFRRGGMRKPNIYTLISVSTDHDVNNRVVEVDEAGCSEKKTEPPQNAQNSSIVPDVIDCCQTNTTVMPAGHKTNACQTTDNCPPDNRLLPARQALKNYKEYKDLFKNKENEKNLLSLTDKTEPNSVRCFKHNEVAIKNDDEIIYLDRRTAMVQITMLQKRLDEIKNQMSGLKTDTGFLNDKDKQQYFELKEHKIKLMKKLNIFYEAVGLEELMKPIPEPKTNSKSASSQNVVNEKSANI